MKSKQLEFKFELDRKQKTNLVYIVNDLTKQFLHKVYVISKNKYVPNNLFLLDDIYKQLVSANNQLHLQTDKYIKSQYSEYEPLIKIYKDIRDYKNDTKRSI